MGGIRITQIQWWVHEIGLTSRPAKATVMTASGFRSLRMQRQAINMAAASVTSESSSQPNVYPPPGNGGLWKIAYHD